jgi:hypothetical protein
LSWKKIKKCFKAQKFKMAAEFKIDAKTLLSFKTCKINYFLTFLQHCLNLASKFNMADFMHKNTWFFGSGTGG